MDMELDTEWLDEQTNIEKQYDQFYNETVSHVKATVVFVDDSNRVTHIKRNRLSLENSILRRSKIVDIVRDNRKLNNTIYSLYAVLQFNYNISPDRVIQGKLGTGEEFFHVIKHIGDIYFDKTIPIFSSLNDITLVLKPKTKKTNQTKRVYLSNSKPKKRKTRKRW